MDSGVEVECEIFDELARMLKSLQSMHCVSPDIERQRYSE